MYYGSYLVSKLVSNLRNYMKIAKFDIINQHMDVMCQITLALMPFAPFIMFGPKCLFL